MRRRWLVLLLLVAPLASAAACGADGDDDVSSASSAGSAGTNETTTTEPDDGCNVEGAAEESPDAPAQTTVQVELGDYSVAPQPGSVPAGTVELVAANASTLIRHELEVVRFDGDPATIPLNFVGGADESQLPDGAVVGKIRVLDPGRSCSATFDLTPGAYVLLCNLVDDGTTPHYTAGMFSSFAVT